MVLASAILSVVPYFGFISILLLWPIATCLLQASINKLVRLGPLEPSSPLLGS